MAWCDTVTRETEVLRDTVRVELRDPDCDTDGESLTSNEGVSDSLGDADEETDRVLLSVVVRVLLEESESVRESVGSSDGVTSLWLPVSLIVRLSVEVAESDGVSDAAAVKVWIDESESDTSTVDDGGLEGVLDVSAGDNVAETVGSLDGDAVSVPVSLAVIDSDPETLKVAVNFDAVIKSEVLALADGGEGDPVRDVDFVLDPDVETVTPSDGVSLSETSDRVNVVDNVESSVSVTAAVLVCSSDTVCELLSLAETEAASVCVTVGEVRVSLGDNVTVARVRVSLCEAECDPVALRLSLAPAIRPAIIEWLLGARLSIP